MIGTPRKSRTGRFVLTMAATLMAGICLAPAASMAGDLTPTVAPTEAGSAMYTLESIYQRLLGGTAGSKRAGAFTDPASIGATMHTLDEIMGISPRTDASGAISADVCGGKTYWGINSSQWGFAAGSPPTPRSGSKDCTVPTISSIANQNINEDTPTSAIAFTIGDTGGFGGSPLRATSSNTALVTVEGIAFGGSGTSRTITVTPLLNQTGSTTITVTVTDSAGNSAVTTFTVNVAAVNDAPAISAVPDETVNEDNPTSAIPFTITDVDSILTCAGSMTGSSSNTTLVPNASIVFTGTAPNCRVTVTPAANQNGSADITLTVSDGTLSAADTFTLTVTAVNDPPVAVNDTASFTKSTTNNNIDALVNDTDVDGDTLSITTVTTPSLGGTVTIETGGGGDHLHYNAPAVAGSDVFYYSISDGNGGTAWARVTVTVTN
jgi:hypothetical protein